MKRLLIAVATLALVWAWAPPAQANHDNADYYIEESSEWLADTWLGGVDRDYCFDGWGPLSSGEYGNMTSTTVEQVNDEWEAGTDITTNWQSVGDCSGDIPWDGGVGHMHNLMAEDFLCQHMEQQHNGVKSRVDYDNLGSGTDGLTSTCDTDNNGRIDFFWIIINDCYHRESCSFNLHFGGKGTSVPEGHFDYAGLFTHEFGHATGFDGHFPTSSGACDIDPLSGYNNMCTDNNIGFKNGSGSEGTAWRTIESHDFGEANQAY